MVAIKDRQKAGRYRTDDDEDDGGAALLAASLGPPAQCAVFRIPDEDETPAEEQARVKYKRERVIGKLRALNLNVDQYTNKDGSKMFVRISAPNTILQYEAEQQRVRLRLREDFGGALCAFSQELDEKGAFDKSLDGFELFSSANQLSMIKEVVYSSPYDDGINQDDDPIDFDELISDEVAIAYFPLHHDRMRLKLLNEWARPVSKPQPLELIREYFGEKIALYYTWFGYYITMLFIPGLTGSALFATQMFYFPLTGTLENPFTPVYAIVMSIWAAAFAQLWQSLENTRKYQWDTLEFENQESVREEFKEAEETLKVNPTP
ncbi:calcium-activated chloride channel-domain-containing protein [Baffinella frigidus]|nr:calcium-activated chloride channel-domain-containing protein [Cryptophyta sp. CCMP2293]